MPVPMTPKTIDEALDIVRRAQPSAKEVLRQEVQRRRSLMLSLLQRVREQRSPEEQKRLQDQRIENQRAREEHRREVIPVGSALIIESDWRYAEGAFTVTAVRMVTATLTRGELEDRTVDELVASGALGPEINFEEKC